MSSSDAAGRASIIAAMRGRHSEMRDFSTVWAITGLHVAPTPPCSMLHRSSSGSAESFHSTVGVVCVIWCSGLFQAAAGMSGHHKPSAFDLETKPAEVVAAFPGALLRGAVAGKHVLLHHDPAIVPGAAQR